MHTQVVARHFQGKVAIVTGAGSGIGRATAKSLSDQGTTVVAVDRRADRLRALEQSHDQVWAYVADVTDHDALRQCVEQTIERCGQIDILVNNVGLSFYARLEESTLEHWRTTMAVNVEAMFALTRLVTPHMMARRYGRIVNVSSTQSIASESTVGAYAATKGAINAWTRSLAVDLAEYGILANVVAPGCIHTEMSVVNGEDETQSDLFQQWYVGQRKIPLARPGRPEEVANTILFLCGDQCTYMTGHMLVVDGGLTITF